MKYLLGKNCSTTVHKVVPILRFQLCGLVYSVPGYYSMGPGLNPGLLRKSACSSPICSTSLLGW